MKWQFVSPLRCLLDLLLLCAWLRGNCEMVLRLVFSSKVMFDAHLAGEGGGSVYLPIDLKRVWGHSHIT